MRVLANDGISEEGAKIITDAGHELIQTKIPQDELKDKIHEYEAIIIRSATQLPKEIIEAGNLKAIARAGVGLDNIDTDFALERGIPVINTPEAPSISVAELALSHAFALARFIHISKSEMCEGKWPKKQYKGFELFDKTLGIIGFGNTGSELAKRAVGLGMKVITHNRTPVNTDLPVQVVSKDDLLIQSDIISLHIPYDSDTGYVIDKEDIEKMNEGTILINCARGGVVNEEALLSGLHSGKIAGAGIDVWENEPCTEKQEELLNHPNVSVSPHIGGSTKEAQDRIGIEIAEKLVEQLKIKGE